MEIGFFIRMLLSEAVTSDLVQLMSTELYWKRPSCKSCSLYGKFDIRSVNNTATWINMVFLFAHLHIKYQNNKKKWDLKDLMQQDGRASCWDEGGKTGCAIVHWKETFDGIRKVESTKSQTPSQWKHRTKDYLFW